VGVAPGAGCVAPGAGEANGVFLRAEVDQDGRGRIVVSYMIVWL